MAEPLHKLTKKELDWHWTSEEQKAFDMLKHAFTTAPILVSPDTDKQLRIESDASDYATGAVLSMLCEDGLWRPCTFLSKGLNDVERNYDVHDKEMLGII